MTGLDTEQLNILRSMWVFIEIEIDMHSRIIFRRFFQEHPEYLRFFRALTHTPSSKVDIDSVCWVHFKAILSCLGTILQCVVNRTPIELRSHIEHVALIHSRTDLTLRDFLVGALA
ncbi:unnamed protein product [Timema podura]|uniref:Hemoglobin n=1 Tax=Timema podura TaxID=61482 RepID=A0ABN7PCP5_TIMPD|nr:unnamed protein product [Timema podura]